MHNANPETQGKVPTGMMNEGHLQVACARTVPGCVT